MTIEIVETCMGPMEVTEMKPPVLAEEVISTDTTPIRSITGSLEDSLIMLQRRATVASQVVNSPVTPVDSF